jgi:hypothetical protein
MSLVLLSSVDGSNSSTARRLHVLHTEKGSSEKLSHELKGFPQINRFLQRSSICHPSISSLTQQLQHNKTHFVVFRVQKPLSQGFGDQVAGMISTMAFAITTGRSFLLDVPKDYDTIFDSPFTLAKLPPKIRTKILRDGLKNNCNDINGPAQRCFSTQSPHQTERVIYIMANRVSSWL